MSTETQVSIEEKLNQFKQDGFVLIEGLLVGSPELSNLQRKIHQLVSIKARQYGLKEPEQSQESVDATVLALNEKNGKIGGFLNDAFNATPEMFDALNAQAIKNVVLQFFNDPGAYICANNHRGRIQIPERDEISNLPWHQDAHYNNFYNRSHSIVTWISISDITQEMGPVVFKKGSQSLGSLQQVEFIKPNGGKVFTLEEKYVNDPRFKEVIPSTKAGDLVLIDMDVVHRSGINGSKNRIKWSAQARYHNGNAKGFLSHYG